MNAELIAERLKPGVTVRTQRGDFRITHITEDELAMSGKVAVARLPELTGLIASGSWSFVEEEVRDIYGAVVTIAGPNASGWFDVSNDDRWLVFDRPNLIRLHAALGRAIGEER